jgi:alkanesulfonate monooxygenase
VTDAQPSEPLVRIPPEWRVFSTCPVPDSATPDDPPYRERVARVARWSEEVGCEGILVYTDNSLPDPWLVADVVMESTRSLCPLVAVQPIYIHPYEVAKLISTLGLLRGRKVYLNMVAGGFRNDLLALDDRTPHDHRYQRLVEYTEVILRLLSAEPPVSYDGEFFRLEGAGFRPPLPAELRPGILLSGSSEAGREAARRLGATAIHYPGPPESYLEPNSEDPPPGIRVGVVAREDEEEAWEVAHRRFPPDREGQLKHKLAMKVTDSVWHRQLSDQARETRSNPAPSPYWLHPFENYKTFCPYLVGSYRRVGEALAAYGGAGYRTIILDIPPSLEELGHISRAFQAASAPIS